MKKIWFDEPAKIWEEALPLGNSRMGGMVYGGSMYGSEMGECIQLNEESIWYGGKMDRNNPDALKNLPKIREFLKEGKISAAQNLMTAAMSGTPNSVHPYQTLGEMTLWFSMPGKVVDYKRELDLEQAICQVSFALEEGAKKIKVEREVFFSHPADCCVLRIKAEQNVISFQGRLERGRFYDGVGKVGENGIRLYGNLGKGGSEFAVMMKGKAIGGSLEVIGEHIVVENAKEVYLYLTADSSYHHKGGEKDADQKTLNAYMNRILDKAMGMTYEELKEEHIADYKELFDRVKLSLMEDETYAALPTKRRLEKIVEGAEDVGMANLLFDFGRYLLISSSRKGGLPATLQGIWNKDFTPAWDSKYTININTEMNYWPAEPCRLSECHEPLFDLIYKLRENGRVTARKMYGCRGFVAHHNTDIHGDTAPQDIYIPATYWVMGAAWLCTHMWQHYLYTKDYAFLQEVYPCMLEAAVFFLDFLVEQDGYLVTNPSCSPENTYILPNGEQGCICIGATMDFEILRDLFEACLKAQKELGTYYGGKLQRYIIPDVDDVDDLPKQIEEALKKLPPIKVDSTGRIMEWMEEYEEAEPGHRHISHLYALYPSDQITVDQTPLLAKAAEKTLEKRLEGGGGHTGWSRAWIMNHYARLQDGEKTWENILLMLRKSTYPNLFDKHPPFQIDGNFGACAAIAQMLVQSYEDRVILLPALPKAWSQGSVSGIGLIGGASIDLIWKKNKLTQAVIHAVEDFQTVVKYGEKTYPVKIAAGEDHNISLS